MNVSVAPLATPLHTRDAVGGIAVRPHYEGTNIGTWLGFKHINYLVEEAILDYLRGYGFGPAELYQRHGLCLDVVELDTRILHALRVDDEATARVSPRPAGFGRGLCVDVTIERCDPAPRKVVSSRARVLLRRDPAGEAVADPPAALAGYTVSRLGTSAPVALSGTDPLAQLTAGGNAFGWRMRIPYFYCHFSRRMQMSGYLRVLEEVVDRFLADRGVSVRRLLDEQGWIPAVPHSSIVILDEAEMEEDLHVVFSVEQVFKRLTYTATMGCFVIRDGMRLTTATGRITHGYARLSGRSEWNLVEFDDWLAAALSGTTALLDVAEPSVAP